MSSPASSGWAPSTTSSSLPDAGSLPREPSARAALDRGLHRGRAAGRAGGLLLEVRLPDAALLRAAIPLQGHSLAHREERSTEAAEALLVLGQCIVARGRGLKP